jgi:tRNA pseudouridine55 synthase
VHGILILDKPSSLTSAAAVARVKIATGARKVGHTGTLDPMATGVLPLCFGDATKLAGYLAAADKEYEGELELGSETNTLDAEGEIVSESRAAAERVDEVALRTAMRALTGDIEQIPPMFSALKQEGRRLHQLARAGKLVDRSPRRVMVGRFELLDFAPPRARFAVQCSKGTYVRTLAADVGGALQCGAHLTALRRTRVGRFCIADAIGLAAVEAAGPRIPLLSPTLAVEHLPSLRIPDARLHEVASGLPLNIDSLAQKGALGLLQGALVALVNLRGDLLALARRQQGELRYERVFTYALTPERESSTLLAP